MPSIMNLLTTFKGISFIIWRCWSQNGEFWIRNLLGIPNTSNRVLLTWMEMPHQKYSKKKKKKKKKRKEIDPYPNKKGLYWTGICKLGPVVQSVVSLTSLLRVISLTVLADSIYNILKFFAEKMWVAFALQKLLTFFQQKISAYLRITWFKF